jgi:putative flippase GtrA
MISFTFKKAQITSVVATGVDFLVMRSLVQLAGVWYVEASAIGTVCGGVTYFLGSRSWVFRAREGRWSMQLGRYVLVWAGNLLLNTSGLYLLTHYTGMNYQVAKIGIAVGVAVFYNYVLQKRFVFTKTGS